jgi:predicted metal-dependent HD superfamily phosphohydrolase
MHYVPPASALQLLIPLYNSPQRHYHDLNHINFMMSKLMEAMDTEEFTQLFNKPVESMALTLAVYFHDAIYSPYPMHRLSNERLSAHLLQDYMKTNRNDLISLGIHPFELDRLEEIACDAIKATEFHFKDLRSSWSIRNQETTFLILDCDMAGFAKPYLEVLGDSDRIFKEYRSLGLPERQMLENRIAFLNKLLAKDTIYYTKYFQDTHEAKARSNIEAVIEASEAILRDIE